jgi:hypothetical protein
LYKNGIKKYILCEYEKMSSSEESYRNFVNSLNVDELSKSLDDLLTKIVPKQNESLVNMLSFGMEHFKFDEKIEFDHSEYQKQYYKGLHKIIVLHHRFMEENLLTDNVYKIKFNKLFEIFHYWELAIRALCRVKIASNPVYDSSMNTDIGLARFTIITPEKNSPYQNLILYLLNCLTEEKLRKQGNMCMERVYTKEGYDTHAWVPKMSFKEFVYSRASKDFNHQQWHNLTSNASNAKNAISYLEDVRDPQFIDVVKDRHLFSFNNGIYETCVYNTEKEIYEDKWYAYEPEENENDALLLDSKRVACKYFDTDFIYHKNSDWYDIPTPYFQSILDYQKFPQDVCRWLYILVCGRILYNVSEMDEWQVMPFLKGKAKSGKSTIVTKVAKEFYHALDVGVLSNNIEKKFGLSALKDKFLFIAPEIKGDIGLEQCDFQTVISGEDTSIPEKFKTAGAMRWVVPGLMAGNEAPQYEDNSGSISRRLVVFNFKKKVTKANTQLGKKLAEELPSLLMKGNRAYMEAVRKYGKKDVWDNVLPVYFKKTQEDMAEQTNSLAHFLASSKLVFGPEFHCRYKAFLQAFNDHVRENNLTPHKFTEDYYSSVFEERKIEFEARSSKLDLVTNRKYTCAWLVGVNLVVEKDMQDDPHDDLEYNLLK